MRNIRDCTSKYKDILILTFMTEMWTIKWQKDNYYYRDTQQDKFFGYVLFLIQCLVYKLFGNIKFHDYNISQLQVIKFFYSPSL